MALNQEEVLAKEILESGIGRYEIVRLALDWISVKKYDEEFRRLPQGELISKAISDVVNGIATAAAIEELKSKRRGRDRDGVDVQVKPDSEVVQELSQYKNEEAEQKETEESASEETETQEQE
ncbi:MAG: hypothetical protein LBV66_02415 [Elusimicrobiota bacterium]|jgi:hypothetical protein|nr:hypothetical protein [Elusimicrobiota bacterium]